ncbi:UvrD-helicase domain-containing protein [Pigmentibacter ruber]
MSLCEEKDVIKIAEKIDSEFHDLAPKLALDTPWGGYIAITDPKKKQPYEFRIGAQANKAERIIDWRHPIGVSFYSLEIGDHFELEAPYHEIQGAISASANAKGYNGNLIELTWRGMQGNDNIIRLENGSFVSLNNVQQNVGAEKEQKQQAILQKQKMKASEHGLGELISLLTKEQYDLISQKNNEAIIIQGKAGSGKTSVALHRVSWLLWEDPDNHTKRLQNNRVLIVMFNRSLKNFVNLSIQALNLEGQVELNTFHAWAKTALEKVYKGQIEVIDKTDRFYLFKEYQIFESDALKLVKSHIGLSTYMEEFVRKQGQNAWNFLEKVTAKYDDDHILATCNKESLAYVQEFIYLKQKLKNKIETETNELKKNKQIEILKVVQTLYEKAILYKEELLNLLSSKENLKKFIPTLTDNDAEFVTLRQKIVQTHKKADSAKVGKYIEFDDFALLLRLIQLKRGGLPYGANGEECFKFDHLVIDEAQDFGAMQLLVMLDSVNSRTGVTIVGDVNQKIAPEKEFMGWEALASLLGMNSAKVTKLEVGHRSTLPIMWLADSIAKNEKSFIGREGAYPQLIENLSNDQIIQHIYKFVLERMEQVPSAHICVVLKKKDKIEEFHHKLNELLRSKKISVRKVLQGNDEHEFRFQAGVSISNIHQIKGLEFDSVIIADAGAKPWNDTPEVRCQMYVAVSRAQEHFIALCEGEGSPLLTCIKNKEFWAELKEHFHKKNFIPIEINAEELEDIFSLDSMELL